MTTADYARARRLLARRDPIIAGLMKRHGPCGLAHSQHEDAFTAFTERVEDALNEDVEGYMSAVSLEGSEKRPDIVA